jgi:hypothetical protein
MPNKAFTAAIVEVSAPGADLAGVRVAAVTLLDAAGRVFARATEPITLRAATPGGGPYDFSEAFTGRVARGTRVRLRLDATLDTRAEVLWRAPPETRARIELAGEGGVRMVIEGPAGPWPTG